MATANEVIGRALRLAGVLASGETAEASIAQDTLAVYNALLAEWHHAEIGVPDYSVAGIASAITTDAADNEAIAYQIALRIAPEYGLSMSPEFMAAAEQSFARMSLRYFQPGKVDSSDLPGSRGQFNIVTGDY